MRFSLHIRDSLRRPSLRLSPSVSYSVTIFLLGGVAYYLFAPLEMAVVFANADFLFFVQRCRSNHR
jgi:hypothetical protein